MSKACRWLLLVGLLSLFSTTALAATIIKDPIDFANYKGKWIVISYWATWCNFCMEEIPELNAFYRAYHNQVAMFSVNYDEEGSLAEHIRESGIAFPTLAYDPKGHFGVGRIRGLPAILLIRPDGRLRRVLIGSQTKASLADELNL
jgi:thiol-disulfide isomerase/thioredoxin